MFLWVVSRQATGQNSSRSFCRASDSTHGLWKESPNAQTKSAGGSSSKRFRGTVETLLFNCLGNRLHQVDNRQRNKGKDGNAVTDFRKSAGNEALSPPPRVGCDPRDEGENLRETLRERLQQWLLRYHRLPSLGESLQTLERRCKHHRWRLTADLGPALDDLDPVVVATAVAPLLGEGSQPDTTATTAVIAGLRQGWLSCNYVPPEGPLRWRTPEGRVHPQRLPWYGGPQPLGGLLAQGLLAPLDRWGSLLESRYRRGSRRRQNPAYSRLLHLLRTLERRSWHQLPAQTPSGRQPYAPSEVGLSGWQLRRQLWRIPALDPEDPNYVRVTYLRHGSALLLSVAGPLTLARQLRLELKLQLAQQGLGSVSIQLQSWAVPTLWLGYRVHQPRNSYMVRQGGAAGQQMANPQHPPLRRVVPRLRLRLPVAALERWLSDRGFLKGPAGSRQPTAYGGLHHRPWSEEERLHRRLREALTGYYGGHTTNEASLQRLLRTLEATQRCSEGRRRRRPSGTLVQEAALPPSGRPRGYHRLGGAHLFSLPGDPRVFRRGGKPSPLA